MTPLTYELRPSIQEIATCRWMTVDDLEASGQVSAVTKHVFKIVRHGLVNGFDHVLVGSSKQPSIYRNHSFNMFSVLAKIADNEDCVRDVVDAPEIL